MCIIQTAFALSLVVSDRLSSFCLFAYTDRKERLKAIDSRNSTRCVRACVFAVSLHVTPILC
jgi:hypothetical protein